MKTLMLLVSLVLTQQAGRPEFGSVRGQVRATDGAPAVGIRVAAMAMEENGVVDPVAATLASLSETDSAGRFHLQNIPPGRYLITAGFLDSPSYYPGVKTPEGARGIAVVAGEAVANIDFTLARSSGVRVRGRVKNIPASAPAGLIRISLQPLRRPGVRPIDIGVAADGTFEFLRVSAGSYNLRMTPAPPTTPPLVALEIGEMDVESLELIAPPIVFGRVTVDDASPLPSQATVSAGMQAPVLATGMQDDPALFRLQTNRGDRVSGIGVTSAATVRRDGVFVLPFPGAGDYMIAPTLMPLRHHIKSMTYGDVDLLSSPLKIGSESGSAELRVVLTTTRPAGTPVGVKVSGRVTGLENYSQAAPLFVSLQAQMLGPNQLMVLRVTEAAVQADGTFEVAGVPPGRYTVRAVPALGSPLFVNIDIKNQDMSGLEVAIRNPASPSTGTGNVIVNSGGPPP